MAEAFATSPRRRELALPLGTLVTERTRVRVTLALDGHARRRARAAVESLHRGAPAWFCLPDSVEDGGGRLVLDYAIDPASLAFDAALPHWRSSLATSLPELIAMARYLESCTRMLAEISEHVPIAPAFLRYLPTSPAPHGAFQLLAIPMINCTVGDWARAAAETWSWQSRDALLGRPGSPGAYAIGAAMHTALAGEVFPVRSVAERFRRALRGQVGTPDAVGEAARGGLPQSFTEEADALQALIAGLLAPEPPADWRDQLARIGEQLDALRVAVRWEYEGEIEIARQILERVAVTARSEQVPWDVLARLRDRDDDAAGARAAALHALGGGDAGDVRALVRKIRGVACEIEDADGDTGAVAPLRDWIAEAIAAIDDRDRQLADLDRLRLAHVEARALGRMERAMKRLARKAEEPWDDIVRRVLLIRFHAGTGDWLHVAKQCKDVRLAIQAMPVTAGAPVDYVIAFVDALDGIAHFGALALYPDAGFLADAFERFAASLDRARAVCAPDDSLVDATIAWLQWIRRMTLQLSLSTARAVASGIDAYLAAHNFSRQHAGPSVPPLVWYDDARLLTGSEAS